VLAAVIGFEGAAYGADAVPLALVQQMLGTGPNIKYSEAGTNTLTRLVAGCTATPFAVSAVNLSYADTGVVGVNLVMRASEAGAILEGVMKGLPALTFTEADLARAKAQLSAGIMFGLEESTNAAHEVATQLLQLGTVDATAQLLDAIDAATLDTVTAAAQKALGSKASIALAGDTAHAPYLDQLQ